MLNLLISGIFHVITTLFNSLFSPLFSAIYALFPNLEIYFGYITSFISTACTYVSAGLDFLLIPQEVVILLFDYVLIKYSIYLISISVKFGIKVYSLLKP